MRDSAEIKYFIKVCMEPEELLKILNLDTASLVDLLEEEIDDNLAAFNDWISSLDDTL